MAVIAIAGARKDCGEQRIACRCGSPARRQCRDCDVGQRMKRVNDATRDADGARVRYELDASLSELATSEHTHHSSGDT
jgi:hypothetical protein